MSLPDPVPGLVVRFSFLWSHEAARGQTEGSKARPCGIIVASRRKQDGTIRVTVAPITHAPPDDETACIEVPPFICKHLGLDGQRQWFRFDELNQFDWPGYDLSPIPGTGKKFAYGFLPEGFFTTVRDAIVKRAKTGRVKAIANRDE